MTCPVFVVVASIQRCTRVAIVLLHVVIIVMHGHQERFRVQKQKFLLDKGKCPTPARKLHRVETLIVDNAELQSQWVFFFTVLLKKCTLFSRRAVFLCLYNVPDIKKKGLKRKETI